MNPASNPSSDPTVYLKKAVPVDRAAAVSISNAAAGATIAVGSAFPYADVLGDVWQRVEQVVRHSVPLGENMSETALLHKEHLEQAFARELRDHPGIVSLLSIDSDDDSLLFIVLVEEYDPDAEDRFWDFVHAFREDYSVPVSAYYLEWEEGLPEHFSGPRRLLI